MNVLFIEQKWSQGEKRKTITTTRYDILATKKKGKNDKRNHLFNKERDWIFRVTKKRQCTK
jgi:hypothetical protein